MGGLGTLDYMIVAIYLIASIALGLRFARGQKNLEDYFVAERGAAWWVAGISIIASDFSAISYIGAPAWTFEKDLQYAMGIFLFPFIMLLIVYLFVPFLARLRMFTVYEYLERRFGLAARTFASGLFLLLRGGHLANAIHAQAIVLGSITQMTSFQAVVLVGSITTLYTVFGGMKAVLWTDVMQFFVLVGGIVAMVIAVLLPFGGNVAELWRIASETGHTRMFNFSLDPTLEITVWGLILGMLIINLSAYGSDQVIVQRYFTTSDRKQMTRAIMFNGLLTVPVVLALYFIGLGFAAYYTINPQLQQDLSSAQQVVPHFITHTLPAGMAGLVIAGLFAATMGSLAAGFNSLSTASTMDFYLRFRHPKEAPDTNNLKAGRWATLLWGVGCTLAALMVGRLGGVVEIMGKINSFFSGPLIGMFLLGLLTRRANSFGVLAGAIIGTIVAWVISTTSVSWLWYGPAGCIITLVAGYLLSFMRPALASEYVIPLTIWHHKGTREPASL